MNAMMDNTSWMMAGMGLIWVLALVALVLIVAAAVKYLFFDKRGKE